MAPVLYAVGIFLSEAPWFFITTVPFWGNERIKKKWIAALLLGALLLRIITEYSLTTYAPDKSGLLDLMFILQPLFLLAVYSVCYKVHAAKLLYATLLTTSISMPIQTLSALIALPFVTLSPEEDVIMEATPAWILAAVLLTAAAIPFVYRMFRRLLRGALSEFSVKTAMYLCAAPALFFVFYAYSVFAIPYFNTIYLIITPISGVFCGYINLRMVQNMLDLARYRADAQMQELKNEYLLENYQQLEDHYKQISETKHEMRHHLFAIRALLSSGEYGQLETYLSDIQDSFAEAPALISCGSRVIQAVLGHAALRARELDFEMEFEVLPLPDLSISDADLVSLLMNLMENALESCANIPDSHDRWIKVKLKTRPPYLCLLISNGRCGDLIISGDSYASTKNDPALHGHGIAVVRKIVEKHSGIISFEHTSDSFCVEIALPVI